MLHLTLRQLQVFLEATRQMNFARAAGVLHLTQPAVSMQIRQLESAVGVELFERVGRRLALTEAGRVLRHHAARVLGEIADADQALQSLKGLHGGLVGVGLVSTAKYFAPRLLARFAEHHPGIDVRFSVGNRDALVHLLEDNEIDLAVMGRPRAKLDAIAEPVAAEGDVAVIPGTFDWDDVGDFAAVARQVRKRNPGNLAILGEASVLSESSTGVLVSETDRLIAIIGVEDLVVVDTDDVLMITTGAHAQRVKEMVNMVRQTGNADLL